ncbi:hypothetical protein DID76_04210 [Candidatus Marinamargulisbacteria bacterium SCGC AG-414-C22]|nr:hypothetical protein DID76_04210 [Candidatus Marinamargulisbacteria bacterium SCGC AG-414-C22]
MHEGDIMIKSSNPALNSQVFQNERTVASSEKMTVQGTVNKTGLLLLCVLATASFTWGRFFNGLDITALTMVGAFTGFIAALITTFKKDIAHISAPFYALAQGLFLGGISAIFEAQYPGIVLQAVGLTFSTCFCLLGAYKSGMIKVTENFKLGVAAATGGLFMFYFISFLLSLFGISFGLFHGNGLFSIGLSLVVVGIAALNLVMDFDFIESGEELGAPKYMEWYSAFGLMVTLIWLYIEILRLLAKLRSRD